MAFYTNRVIKGFLLCFLLQYATLSLSSQEQTHHVLVLHTFHENFPWEKALGQGFKKSEVNSGTPLHIYHEYIDSTRLGYSLTDDQWGEYLQKKYKNIPLGAVIGVSTPACEVIDQNLALWPHIPVILLGDVNVPSSENVYTLQIEFHETASKTIQLAIAQNPKVKNIVLIDGKAAANAVLTQNIKDEIALYPDINLITLKDFTMEELIRRIKDLPPDSIMLYTLILKDSTGKSFVPREALVDICKKSPVPVYSFWSTLLNTGMIGGYLIDGEIVAQEAIAASRDYIRDGQFKESYRSNQYYLDWNSLKEYKLKQPKSLKDITIINKPLPLFQVYLKEVLISLTVLLGLFLFLALLWVRKSIKSRKELQKLNAELEEARRSADMLARRDTLTGLLNRRAVTPIIHYEIQRKVRMDTPVSLLIADIDHFKKVNDEHGHNIGDDVLKIVAESLKTESRKTDTVARWGGEEFLVLVPDTNGDHALHLAEKIRKEIQTLFFPICGAQTVSIGVAELRKGELFESWFERADKALYTAKDSGRNCCILADNSQES